MRSNKVIVKLVIVLTLCLLHQLIFATPPSTISYQGFLRDSDNQPLNGNYDLTVRLYYQATGGDDIWMEIHNGTVVQEGVFAIQLGSILSFESYFFGNQYWLSVQIDNEVELEPRVMLAATPYSFKAGDIVAEPKYEQVISPLQEGYFEWNQETYTDIPYLNLTMSCDGGPVLLNMSLVGQLEIEFSEDDTCEGLALFKFFRDGIAIGYETMIQRETENEIWGDPPSGYYFVDLTNFPVSLTYIDNPPVGLHTYSVRVYYSGEGDVDGRVEMYGGVLNAYELK